WGLWVSGLVPIIDPQTGEMLAVLGMDITARTWNWQVAGRAALPVGLILALLISTAAVLAATRRAEATPKPVLRRLLPPLTALLIMLIAGAAALLWQQQRQRLVEESQRKLSEVNGAWRQAVEKQTTGLTRILERLVSDATLQKALRERNADRLLAIWRPVFETLQWQNSLAHFHFLDAQRIFLLGFANPDKYSRLKDRFTSLQAERTGKTASGIELGPLGGFLLWVVQPVFANGKLIGYVELGKAIDEVFSSLHYHSGLEIAVTIRKDHLDRGNWKKETSLPGSESDWDRLPGSVIVYASQARLPDVLALLGDRDPADEQNPGEISQEIACEGKAWMVSASPLRDASGQEVGSLLVMIDVSAQKAAYARWLGLLGTSSGVILFGLLCFVWVILRRTDRGIRLQQEELRQSEAKYRLVFENAPLGIMHYDQEGTITDLNEAFAGIFGPGREEIIGFNIPRQLHNEQLRQALGASLNGQIGYYEGEYLSDTDGRPVQIRAFFRSVFTETGTFLGGVSIFEDFSERYRAEQKQQESLNFLQILLDAIPNPVFYKDTSGIYLGCNKACEAAWGRSRENLIGRTDFEVHPENLAALHEAQDRKLLSHPGDIFYDITYEAADRIRKTILIHKATFHKLDGRLGGIIGVEVDLTERKQAEEELEQSLSLLKATLESTTDGLLVIDTSDRIVVYNNKFAQMWRIPETVLISRQDDRALAYVLEQLRDPEGFLSKVKSLYSRPEAESYDLLEFKDGRVFERYSQPQRIGQHIVGRVWSFRDITEKRRMEDSLIQAQKMEAVGRLAGGVAHDFNNLLSAIIGYSEILMLDLKTSDPFYNYAQEILRAGKRGEALTRQLLAFSRKQILQPQVIDLNTVITDMKTMLQVLLGENIKLVTVSDSALGAVRVDPGQMEQVIMNLAVNARDAMPFGGVLTLETANVTLDEDYTSRQIAGNLGPYVMLTVSDTGEGMDSEVQAHMFEPFFTTKDQGKGTGLGLATVYGIVKQSGGFINVYSESGKGSVFKIYLPQAQEPLEMAQVREISPEQLAGQETVLLVEDNDSLRPLIGRALEKYGYQVLEARDGYEALSQVKQHPGNISLMVTDVVMPGISGSRLAESLKTLQPDMKVIYMSGYTEDVILRHGVQEKSINFIQKPFNIAHLLIKMREVIAPGPVS
ncbi:MAG: PAS domain S-box protein, partial [Deltaproteobacteria bacterium]|nr:PAS domain S-box protein [Deltaproteobacteria bacterium]